MGSWMKSYRPFSLLLLCSLPLLSACEPPDVVPAADQTGVELGLVEGDVVALGPARGDAVLLLFRADAPPPPEGTGRPVNFLVVPQEQLFAGAADGDEGPFTAHFQLPLIAPGQYTLRGFLDADRDWNPFFWITNLPTAGDIGGGHVQASSGTFTPFEVEAGKVAQAGAIFSSAGGAGALPYERPAFELVEGGSIAADATAPVRMKLRIHPLDNPYVRQTPEAVRFLYKQQPPAGDGLPTDENGDGLPDTYPKVFLKRMSDDPLLDDPEDVLIPAIADPVPFLFALRDGATIPVEELDVIVPPVAIHSATRERIPLREGRYAILVIHEHGQLWRIPNELAPGEDLLEGTPIAAELADATQAGFFEVTAPVGGKPPGGLAGTVTVEEPGSPVVVLAFLASSPPPPAGTGSPVGVALISPDALLAGGGSAPFAIGGLAPADYLLVALLDVDRNFSPFAPALQGSTSGDRVLAAGPFTVAEEVVSGIELDLALGATLPLARPAFDVPGGLTIASDASSYTPFRVVAAPSPSGLAAESGAQHRFTVGYLRDASGAKQDADGDGLADLWPKLFLLKLSDADPTGRTEEQPRVAIPCTVNPLPWLPALEALPATQPYLLQQELELLAAPAAVSFGEGGVPVPLAAIPPGRYGLTVINATGQTWRVPNELGPEVAHGHPAELAREGFFATVTEIPQERAFGGSVSGTVTFAGPEGGNVFLFLFSVSDLPPPEGTGRPVRAGRVTLAPGGGSVPFAIPRVPPGTYVLRALLDADADFHPYFDVTAGATLGDVGGGLLGPGGLEAITVAGAPVPDLSVTLVPALTVPTERPAFRIEGQAGELTVLASDAVAPARLRVTFEPGAIPGDPSAPAPGFLVVPQGPGGFVDQDFDNLPDVFPRVLVAKLDDTDPLGLRLASPPTLIPAAVDPTYLLPLLEAGQPVALQELELALQPAAVQPQPDGSLSVLPEIPPGAYAVVLIGATGQSWQLPNLLGDQHFPEESRGLWPAAAGQGARLRVSPPALPDRGSISGVATYGGAERGNVYVLAFAAGAPPPPEGLGQPVAATAVPLSRLVPDGAGFRAPFRLRGLPPGSYTLRLLLDADRDFVPTLSVRAGATQGDIAGAVANVEVAFGDVVAGEVPLLVPVPLERPSFEVDAAATPPRASRAAMPAGSIQVAGALKLDALALDDALVRTDPGGVAFLVRFTDDDADGAPDLQGGAPLLWPKVFLRHLDVAGVPDGPVIPCLHDPSAYPALFDAGGAPLMAAMLPAASVTCGFLNAAIDPATGAATLPPPQGSYSILAINPTGQSWEVPNELDPANFPAGSPLDSESQAVTFELGP